MQQVSGRPRFMAADYAVFACTLVISLFIGLFYGFRLWRAKSGTDQYLLAGRNMHFIPVALSLSVTYISSVTFLGSPGDTYKFGSIIWWIYTTNIVVTAVATQIYIPVFYRLGLTSTYEYLELRFNKWIRFLVVSVFLLQTLLYMGINIFGPSLALNAVTGVSMDALILTMGIVCTVYTMLGGMKAVIWTDVLQSFVMIGGLIAVITIGSSRLGGFQNVWDICEKGGRTNFLNAETDPRYRGTVWAIIVGGSISWSGIFCCSQPQVQRYLCCKAENHAKWALFLNALIVITMGTLVTMGGMTAFAFYDGCDPLTQGCITTGDQITPYLVMDVFQGYSGLAGFFLSSIVSAALSSVSSGINALATVLLEDVVKRATAWEDWKYTTISKIFVLMFGLLSIGCSYLISVLGDLLQVGVSLFLLIGGPLLGLFVCGVHLPFVNSAGALSGFLCGIAINAWYFIGSRQNPAPAYFTRPLPLSASHCTTHCGGEFANTTYAFTTTPGMTSANMTSASMTSANMILELNDGPPDLTGLESFYALSYLHMGIMGLGTCVIVGIIVGLATGGWSRRKEVNRKLLMLPGNYWMFSRLSDKLLIFLSFGMDMKKNPADAKPETEMVEKGRRNVENLAEAGENSLKEGNEETKKNVDGQENAGYSEDAIQT